MLKFERSIRVLVIFIMGLSFFLMGCGGDSSTNDTESTGSASTSISAVESLCISEFMANNDSVIEDPDEPGIYEDWIEIHNPNSSDIDMGGMYLTDELGNPTKWHIPDSVIVPANGYLLFWADNDEAQGPTHTNFKLDRLGEEIGLFDKDSSANAAVDKLTFDEQTNNMSYGRISGCGTTDWKAYDVPTPGQENSGS